jgi:uncharacterized membrane protein
MLRRALAEREPHVVRGFRHRGHHDVARIESFSDAVFGFSLTLLVVSLEVPKTFDQLLDTMSGFPAFAISFALLANIWYRQYVFFRRYGLQDRTTIVLNMALLFTVVFFTYPLKFLFRNIVVSAADSPVRPDQVGELFVIYGLGYAAVFAILALLYRHAYGKREELELTPREQLETLVSLRADCVNIGVALLSIAVALALSAAGLYGLAGFAGGIAYPLGIWAGLWLLWRYHKPYRAELQAAENP